MVLLKKQSWTGGYSWDLVVKMCSRICIDEESIKVYLCAFKLSAEKCQLPKNARRENECVFYVEAAV